MRRCPGGFIATVRNRGHRGRSVGRDGVNGGQDHRFGAWRCHARDTQIVARRARIGRHAARGDHRGARHTRQREQDGSQLSKIGPATLLPRVCRGGRCVGAAPANGGTEGQTKLGGKCHGSPRLAKVSRVPRWPRSGENDLRFVHVGYLRPSVTADLSMAMRAVSSWVTALYSITASESLAIS